MNRRFNKSFNDLVIKNKLEIQKDPKELERIEKKIDDKHCKTTVNKRRFS